MGSNQSFDYDAIRDSMITQFPEGKAPPPLFGVSIPSSKGQGKAQTSFKGGRNGMRPRLVNVADKNEDEEPEEAPADAAEDAEGEEEEPDGVVEVLAEQLQETLTVTADKLKALTQARRYSTPARRVASPPRASRRGPLRRGLPPVDSPGTLPATAPMPSPERAKGAVEAPE